MDIVILHYLSSKLIFCCLAFNAALSDKIRETKIIDAELIEYVLSEK